MTNTATYVKNSLERPIFLYDADCGVCTDTVQWLKARGAEKSIEFAPYQSRGDLLARIHLSERECREAAWLVEARENGVRLYRGAAAINAGLRATKGTLSLFWRLLGHLYPLPLVRQLEDIGYAWFARNRHRFSRNGNVCSIEEM